MFFRSIAMTLMVAAMAMAQTTTTTTRSFTIGPVGVGSTETIQVNIANLATNSANGTAASCTGSIAFNNATGTAIGTATTFTVTANQIFSASLPFSRIAASGVRAEVLGVISLTTSSTANTRTPCSLHYSLETFDTATGATHVHVTGVADGFGGGGGR